MEGKQKVLKQSVKRNIERFPKDFMLEMTHKELESWRSQIAASNSDKMGLKYLSFCFAEQGVAMLSSVLKSYCCKYSDNTRFHKSKAGFNL